ncbi:MAG: tetratricopeptide repeat protein [bacterium]
MKVAIALMMGLLFSAILLEGADMKEAEARHYMRAAEYYRQRDYKNALREFDAVLAINPQNDGAHYMIAEIFYIQNNYENAVKEIKAALSINPQNPYAHYLLGLIYKAWSDEEFAKFRDITRGNVEDAKALVERYKRLLPRRDTSEEEKWKGWEGWEGWRMDKDGE